jgi:hypothetical protein
VKKAFFVEGHPYNSTSIMLPPLLEPWVALDAVAAAASEAELMREASPGHAAHRMSVKAVARRLDCDDVLFLVDAKTTACAVVHLTWSRRPKNDPKWPTLARYSSIEEWVEKRMKPDHEDYIA